jgi:hypothetical protein
MRDPAWLTLLFSILGWVAMILWNVFKGGTKAGEKIAVTDTQMKFFQDQFVELKGQIVEFKANSNRRFDEVERWQEKQGDKLEDLRVKVAAFTGESNGN